MREWLLELDALLRGEATSEKELGDGLLQVSARGLSIIVLILAMLYGVCMGSFSLLKEVPPELAGGWHRVAQLLATMVKVPALFFLTLAITFPSLYVFNALVGSRLRLLNLLRLLIASLAVNVAVLASLGLIVAFFSLSTNSYPFVVLLNVVVFSVSGVLGLMFLLQTMHRMTAQFVEAPTTDADSVGLEVVDDQDEANDDAGDTTDGEPAEPTAPDVDTTGLFEPSALDMPEGHVFARHTRIVFRCWVVLFAVVGAQMGWVLRPFIGSPDIPFTLFRDRESSFFSAVLRALYQLLFGG